MAKYTGPTNKLFRNYGVKDLSNRKLTTSMRQHASGQHGAARKKNSDYALQLKAKQNIRMTYLVSEKQFAKYYETATRKTGVTGTIMLQTLESRLDNVIYKAGFAITRRQARQIVNHSQIAVNGKKVNIASYLVKPGDVISVRETKQDNGCIKANVEANANRPIPAWLEKNKENMSGKVLRLASRDDIDIALEEHLIVELYSK